MGQPIVVVEKRTAVPGVVRFEINRSLTGMGHERYRRRDDAVGNRPPDVLARRLFDHGGVKVVHVYSNVITAELADGATSEGMIDVLRELFLYYRPGDPPPPDPVAPESTEPAPSA